MAKRILMVLVLMVVLTLAGSRFAQATAFRRVEGDVAFRSPPEWFVDPPLKIWMHYNVQQIGRSPHVSGEVSWMMYSEDEGWRYLDSRPTCMVIGEHEGKPSAVIVTQIVERIGWGWGEPGEYAYFWVRDGGTPGSEGDQWGMAYYSFDPFTEFYPANDPPPCEYFTPYLQIPMEGGDLDIRP